MKNNLSGKAFLNHTFSCTSISPEQVQAIFYDQRPSYLKNGLSFGQSGKLLVTLSLTDRFEIILRKYIIGEIQEISFLLSEAEIFHKSVPSLASSMCLLVFISVRRLILQYELYELLPRYQEARNGLEQYLSYTNWN
ncbi:hypothetical protein GCM10028805_27400 [Spirosoma harenae]